MLQHLKTNYRRVACPVIYVRPAPAAAAAIAAAAVEAAAASGR